MFMILYKSLVRPVVEYIVVQYGILSTKKESLALEKVQKRATKLIPHLRDHDYEAKAPESTKPSSSKRRGDLLQSHF